MRVIRPLIHLLLAAAGATAATLAAAAGMGPLKPLLQDGADGPWTGRWQGAAWTLRNDDDASAIHYTYGPVRAGTEGRREVGVTVTLDDAAPRARAGLVYGYDAKRRSYWLVVAGPAGEIDLIRRDEQGFRTRMSRQVPRRAGQPLRLTLREQGRELQILADGEPMSSLANDDIGHGAIGIAAIGTGRFVFDRYDERAGGAAAPPAATSKAPTAPRTGAPRLVARTLEDPFGFERPVPAFSLSVPEGWRMDGSIRWDRQTRCWVEQVKANIVMSSPDGRERFELIPGGAWQWSSEWAAAPQLAQMQVQRTGCAVRPITDGRSFMQTYVRALRPGATVLGLRPVPEDAARLQRDIEKEPPTPGARRWGEAWEARLSYPGEGGETVHEVLSTGIAFFAAPMASMSGRPAQLLVALVVGTGSSLAVGREPDLALTKRIGDSVQMLPEYTQRVRAQLQNVASAQAAALQRERQAFQAMQVARAQAARSSPANAGGDSVLDSNHASYLRRQKMIDEGQSRVVDVTHGRQAWNNGDGQVVYLPQQYRRAYQLPNDVYVGTNDPFFNPMQGTAMQPTR